MGQVGSGWVRSGRAWHGKVRFGLDFPERQILDWRTGRMMDAFTTGYDKAMDRVMDRFPILTTILGYIMVIVTIPIHAPMALLGCCLKDKS